MPKIIAIVGMTGSGKSEVTRVAAQQGYPVLRFGDVTDKILTAQGLPINEANERVAREALRQELGMEAYAIRIYPLVLDALKKSDVAVLDGLYSWQEYKYLHEKFGENIVLLAVYTTKKLRYARLATRKVRPLTNEEAAGRDIAEIENLSKGGPIAFADYLIVNDGTTEELEKKVLRIIEDIEKWLN